MIPDVNLSQTQLDALVQHGTELGLSIIVDLAGAFVVFALAWVAGRWVRRAVTMALHRAGADSAMSVFIARLARWGVVLIGVFTCLGLFGVETTSFAAILGGAGVGVGLALKGELSNFSSGLLLLMVRPFREGDWVRVGEVEGRIREIRIMTTTMDTLDNRRLFIPNEKLFDDAIENRSFHDLRRVDVPVGVSYDTDLREAERVLREALRPLAQERSPEDPHVRLEGFGGSSIDFSVGVWARSDDYLNTRHAMIHAIKEALDEAGISIPFPQVDVHLGGGSAAPEALRLLTGRAR
ncbi:MAG: mechanosensitive ion channel family protein [Alphaproteobacteria bacterium]|nr:mechanosensitive ion channel family protein [Alphaproteobacteria bacterium]